MRAGFALLFVLFAGVPAYAHHSFAATYFEDQTVRIEGKLVDFDFRSPHSLVSVEVADDHGKVNTWMAEWRSSARLSRDGLSKESLRPGDHVIITGSPWRTSGEHRVHLKIINRPLDGFKWSGGGPR
jgi:hypothetical protein